MDNTATADRLIRTAGHSNLSRELTSGSLSWIERVHATSDAVIAIAMSANNREDMAEAFRFECDNCAKAIEAWSDGNPYFIDPDGTKQYAYHPRHDLLARCTGNDVPHLCLGCGTEFIVDSRESRGECPSCNSLTIVDLLALEGCACPYCNAGRFVRDEDHFCIS